MTDNYSTSFTPFLFKLWDPMLIVQKPAEMTGNSCDPATFRAMARYCLEDESPQTKLILMAIQ